MRPEGIWECNGCGRTYPEYVNGCVQDHSPPRKVVCVVMEFDQAALEDTDGE